jgi:hypothetical protein
MAKLPTRESLGGLPRTGGSPGISQLNVSGIESAGSAIATGAANLGKGIEKVGDVAYDYQKKAEDHDAEMKFQEFQWNELKGLDDAKRNMQPGQADKFGDTYTAGYQERAKQFFTTVPERLKPHYDQKLFSTERSLYGDAAQFGRTEQKRFAIDGLSTNLENINRPWARKGDLDGATENWEKAVRSTPGLTPIEQDEIIQQGKKKIALSHLDGLPPDQVNEVLGRVAGRTPGAAPLPGEDVGPGGGLPSATAEFFRARSSGRVEGLDPQFGGRLAQAAQDFEAQTGSRARFSDLKRTTEEQAGLYDRYRRGEGGLAAPPGHSRHEGGYAADVPRGPFLDWLHENAPKYGLEFLSGAAFRADPVHVQMAGGRPSISPPDAGTVALPPSASALSTLSDEDRERVLKKASSDRAEEWRQTFSLAAISQGQMPDRKEVEQDKALNEHNRDAVLKMYDAVGKQAETRQSAEAKDAYNAMIGAGLAGEGAMPTRDEIEKNSQLSQKDRNLVLQHFSVATRQMVENKSKDRGEQIERALIDAQAGVGTLPERSSIAADGDLTDTARNHLLKTWAAAAGNISKFQDFDNRFTKGDIFNLYSKDDRSGIDTLFKNYAANSSPEVALKVIVDRTGMVPESAASRWRGDLVSGDTQRVGGALTWLSSIYSRNPHIFAGEAGEKDLDDAALKYQHYTERFGMSADEATKRFIETEKPEYKAKVQAKIKDENISDIVKKNVKVDDLRSAFDDSFLGLAPNPVVGFTPEVRRSMLSDYEELFRLNYLDSGDVSLAKSNADTQLKRNWGVTTVSGSKTVMRNAPEIAPAFRDIENLADKIAADAIASIKDFSGHDVDRSKLRLDPLENGDTARNGHGPKVPYRLSWTDKNGLPQIGPRPLVLDAEKMRREQKGEEDRQDQLRKERKAMIRETEGGDMMPIGGEAPPPPSRETTADVQDTFAKLTAGPRNMLGNIAKQWGARRPPEPAASPTALPETPPPGPDASGY